MDDIISALNVRLRNPVFGYFFFAFLALNWQAIFYLLVQDGDVVKRIEYVEANSNFWSAFLWPFLSAITISVLYPWVLFILSRVISKPIELKELLQVNAEHRLLLKKQELEKARSSIFAEVEDELISRAKRDQQLANINDDELRADLKLEIEKLRSERDTLRNGKKNKQSNDLMNSAQRYRERAEKTQSFPDREKLLDMAMALEQKAHELILNDR